MSDPVYCRFCGQETGDHDVDICMWRYSKLAVARKNRTQLRADLFRSQLAALTQGVANHDPGFIAARIDLAWQYVDQAYPEQVRPEEDA